MRDFMIALLTCSATMSALALAYMMAMPLLSKRYAARGRYCAWLIILIGLIVPFRPHFGGALVQLDVPTAALLPIVERSGAPLMVARSAGMPGIPLWDALGAFWLAGMIAFLVHHAMKHRRFIIMTKRWSGPIADERALALLRGLMAEMGLSGPMGLYSCACVGSPMLIGILKPKILLPGADYAPDALRLILKHELVHHRRRDLWGIHLALLATAMHWFNPVVYLMVRAMDVQCELSCDAETVRSADAGARRYYTETIIGTVRSQSRMRTALSTNFYGGKRGMKNRIISIMDMGRKRAGVAVICAALIVTLGTGLALAANVAVSAPPATTYEVAIADASQSEIDRGAMYERYRQYGLTYDAATDELRYGGELVRVFEDYYPIGEYASAGAGYFNQYGTIDIHGVRDLSRIARNADGSSDPSGTLMGVAPYSQAEFDARDITALINPPPQVAESATSVVAEVTVEPPRDMAEVKVGTDGAAATTYAASSGDPMSPDQLAEMYAIYEPFGLSYDKDSDALYYEGKRVGLFRDVMSSNGESMASGNFSGAIRNMNSPDGEIDIHTVRDYDRPDANGFGMLIGLEVAG